MALDDELNMTNIEQFNGYKFCKDNRWCYIQEGFFYKPGEEPRELTFVTALKKDDYIEFLDDFDNSIGFGGDKYSPPFYIMSHKAEIKPGNVLIIGYKFGRFPGQKWLGRRIDKVETPFSYS